jgi:hypothetical protein
MTMQQCKRLDYAINDNIPANFRRVARRLQLHLLRLAITEYQVGNVAYPQIQQVELA